MPRLSWLIAGLLTLVFAGSTPALAQNPCKVNTNKVMSEIRFPHSDLTLLAAHRGVHAMYGIEDGYRRTPENSLQAIQNAANECIEIIELDVRATQDGVPIISHDSTWGRETNVGAKYASSQQTYSPWNNTGPNPAINTWKLADVKRDLTLRDSVDFSWSSWNESPPTLRDAILFMKSHGITSVLALDVKDLASLQNAWAVVVSEGYWDHVFFKVDANIFPTQQKLSNFFLALHYVTNQDAYPDLYYVKIMPIYNTANIAPNNGLGSAGGEGKIWDSAGSFSNPFNAWIMGLEWNIKSTNGIMSTVSRNSEWRGAKAIFNPRREYQDSNGTPLYFNSDGRCCSQLSAYWFNGSPYGLPSDYEDRRSDWSFVLDENAFSLITTDNVLQIRGELQKRNRRAVWRIRD